MERPLLAQSGPSHSRRGPAAPGDLARMRSARQAPYWVRLLYYVAVARSLSCRNLEVNIPARHTCDPALIIAHADEFDLQPQARRLLCEARTRSGHTAVGVADNDYIDFIHSKDAGRPGRESPCR
jgi:hypothetical protein